MIKLKPVRPAEKWCTNKLIAGIRQFWNPYNKSFYRIYLLDHYSRPRVLLFTLYKMRYLPVKMEVR